MLSNIVLNQNARCGKAGLEKLEKRLLRYMKKKDSIIPLGDRVTGKKLFLLFNRHDFFILKVQIFTVLHVYNTQSIFWFETTVINNVHV